MASPESLRLQTSLQVKVYDIKPDMKTQFLAFCNDVIRPWLIDTDRAKQSRAWIHELDGRLQLLIVLESNDEPWSGIPGLGAFLRVAHPLTFEEVIDLRIP